VWTPTWCPCSSCISASSSASPSCSAAGCGGVRPQEPAIGHTKPDHGLQRYWLKGAEGDALHAVLCAAGYNLRWLLRTIVRLGLKATFLRLHFFSPWPLPDAPRTPSRSHPRRRPELGCSRPLGFASNYCPTASE
jgi:hypothetical protein